MTKIIAHHALHLDNMFLEIVVEEVRHIGRLVALTEINHRLPDQLLHLVVLSPHFEPVIDHNLKHLLHEYRLDVLGVLVEVTRIENFLPPFLLCLSCRHYVYFTQ